MTSMGFVLNSYVSLNFAPVYHFRTLGKYARNITARHVGAIWKNTAKTALFNMPKFSLQPTKSVGCSITALSNKMLCQKK